jgi:peptide/nickel transport system substrate-binding protein
MKWRQLAAACLVTVLSVVPAFAGGTLVVCDDVQDPMTLDPQKQFSEKNHTIVQQIFDGLVRFNKDGKIEPALATEWTMPTKEDPFRWRFKLRQGVAFHNGEPFNAEAVRFSIMRYFDPATHAPAPFAPAAPFISTIKAVEVVDGYTVDIVTGPFPDGLLLNRLAGFVVMVPPKYVNENGSDALHNHPVGTGAFRFEKWNKGQSIELSANKSYWLEGSPKLDKLVFRFIKAEDQAKALLAGEVDLVTELPGTLTTEVMQNTGTRVEKKKAFWTIGASFNTTEGPLADVRVRKALNLAINRDDLIRYDSRGNGVAIASLTMDGEEGHNPDLKPYPYDVEQAKKLLAEAGVKTPLVLKTIIRAQAQRTVSILAAQLKQIGVQLDVKAALSDAEVMGGIQSEKWDVTIGALPDPMCHSFFAQSILLFSQSPFSVHKNPEFDQKLGMMMTQLDPGLRTKLGQELDAYVHENALSLFTYQKVKTYGLNRKVRFEPYISGMPYFFSADIVEESTAGATDSAPAVSDATPTH